jgi:protease II
LRHLKTDNNPIILQVKRQGGHNGGSGRYDNLQEFARAYAFALQVLDPAVP